VRSAASGVQYIHWESKAKVRLWGWRRDTPRESHVANLHLWYALSVVGAWLGGNSAALPLRLSHLLINRLTSFRFVCKS
jgi:hypothetical protein